MSRGFIRDSNNCFLRGPFDDVTVPITLAAWFYSTNADLAQVVMSVADSSTDMNWNIQVRGDSSDQVWAATSTVGGGISYAIATKPYSVNTWHHACGVFTTDSDRRIYLDGGNTAQNTVSRPVSSVDRWQIGMDADLNPYACFSGYIGEAGVWRAALTAAEVWRLYLGAPPNTVRPGSLIAYLPLVDSDMEWLRGYHMAPYNGPYWGPQPPAVTNYRRKIWPYQGSAERGKNLIQLNREPRFFAVANIDLLSILVDIDHESGTLDEYTSTSDATDLAVTSGAAMGGSVYGLQVTIDDTTASYGQFTLGAADTSEVVSARIYIDPNGYIGGSSGQYLYVLGLYPSSGTAIGYIWLEYTTGPTYYIRGVIVNDVPSNIPTAWYAISDEPHYVEIKITRSESGSPTGELKLWIDGDLKETVSSVDNYDIFYNFQSVRVGCNYVSGAGTPSGTIYLDEIVVNNDGSYIGPLFSGVPVRMMHYARLGRA